MRETRLIVRLPDPAAVGATAEVPLNLAVLVEPRLGEAVIFGLSEVPGVWTFVGEAELVSVTRRRDVAILGFTEVTRFDPAVPGVTDSTAASDAYGLPFNLDELDEREYAEMIATATGCATGAALTAAEAGAAYRASEHKSDDSRPWWTLGVDPSHPLHKKVIRAYSSRCAMTGVALAKRNGQREGVVMPVYSPGPNALVAVSEAIPLTGTIAFYYAKGLIGIAPTFRLIIHPVVDPAIVRFIEDRNPEMRLILPESPADWPDQELMRRHIDHFGL